MDNDLFFVTAKLFWQYFNPGSLLISGTVLGIALLWTRWHRFAKYLATAGVLIIMLITTLPVADKLTYLLEDRFPKPDTLPEKLTGIILLGGSFDLDLSHRFQYPVPLESGDRIFAALELWERYPEARFFFSGAAGQLNQQGKMNEADTAYLFFKQYGLEDRVEYENRSRNTYENAIYTKSMAQPKPGEKWILVTSAVHMPRSVGIFRKAGWEVIPFPVKSTPSEYRLRLPSVYGLHAINMATKEWIGLIAYFILGKTDVLFPSP